MDFLDVTFTQRLLIMALLFFTTLATLTIVHRHRHEAGWVLKQRLPELVFVGGATFSFGVFLVPLLETDERVALEFHRLYHDEWYETTILPTHWQGVRLIKCPFDLWVVQEIFHDTKPDVLIEFEKLL